MFLTDPDPARAGARLPRPAGGVPLGAAPLPTSASFLAQRLHGVTNAGYNFDPPPSLAGVPALIPQIANLRDREVVMRFLRELPGHRRVRQLAASMDTLLTSVAPDGKPLGHVGRVVLQQIGLSQAALRKLVITEMAGVLLGEKSPSTPNTELETLISHRTGIEEHDIERCAKRAREGKYPGVVVVAVGKAKVDSVRECVQRGLVNMLIVDEHLARALILALQR